MIYKLLHHVGALFFIINQKVIYLSFCEGLAFLNAYTYLSAIFYSHTERIMSYTISHIYELCT
jgi:hypothetical protein